MIFFVSAPVKSPRTQRQRTTSQSTTTTSRSREPILRGRRRTIYTAGRPPWYDCQGQLVEPFVVGEYSNISITIPMKNYKCNEKY